jgi:CBS domain-containing protein
MTPNPACCTPDSTLQEVARMMKDNDCGLIPVVSSLTDMKPVGTVTDRDITIRTLANNQDPMKMKAADVMTSEVATVTPETTLEQCFDVMEDREIRRVLVIDERGRCCGIVAQADVVQSGINPIRTNRVIREISESSPSRVQSSGGNYRSSLRGSMPSSSSLFPLLVGLGSGVALMYMINTRQRSGARRYYGELHPNHETDFTNAGNQENFARYVDAEEEIEKRQHNLKDRLDAARTQSDFSTGNRTELIDHDDDTIVNREKRRTARGGNS